MALLVQKYGGTSVADSTRIINVAKRIAAASEAGNQVVSVVSAMGNTTDRLIELAHEITPEPSPRELDFLLSTGEIVSCTLLAMALRELGAKAISLSGAQAGIQTDASTAAPALSRWRPAGSSASWRRAILSSSPVFRA